jgi:hypothetical protein
METTITIIRDCVAIVTLPLILYRLWILKSRFSQDHERSRNEKAVDLIRDWTKILNQKSSAARKIVEQLDNQTCIKLNKQEKISIDKTETNLNLLKAVFEEEINSDSDKVEIDIRKSTQLRWEIITYLNILESVLIAYRHNVADRQIIKEQFRYLVNPTENHFVLEEFRKATGEENFPGIKDFAKELKEEREQTPAGKSKTGFLTKFKSKNKK